MMNSLLENAIVSIQLGLEDYASEDTRRSDMDTPVREGDTAGSVARPEDYSAWSARQV